MYLDRGLRFNFAGSLVNIVLIYCFNIQKKNINFRVIPYEMYIGSQVGSSNRALGLQSGLYL